MIPDEISESALENAQRLAEDYLAGASTVRRLWVGTTSPELCYQTICCLARTIAIILRPAGSDGRPIGARVAGSRSREGLRDHAAACRLIGSAAMDDAPMVRALALPVAEAGVTASRSVIRSMLTILAAEPVRQFTQEGPPNV